MQLDGTTPWKRPSLTKGLLLLTDHRELSGHRSGARVRLNNVSVRDTEGDNG